MDLYYPGDEEIQQLFNQVSKYTKKQDKGSQMKITKTRLKQIIKEELAEINKEFPTHAATHAVSKEEEWQEEILSLEDEVQYLADSFGVHASVEIDSNGNPAIAVYHKNGDLSAYYDPEDMYRELAKRSESEM